MFYLTDITAKIVVTLSYVDGYIKLDCSPNNKPNNYSEEESNNWALAFSRVLLFSTKEDAERFAKMLKERQSLHGVLRDIEITNANEMIIKHGVEVLAVHDPWQREKDKLEEIERRRKKRYRSSREWSNWGYESSAWGSIY